MTCSEAQKKNKKTKMLITIFSKSSSNNNMLRKFNWFFPYTKHVVVSFSSINKPCTREISLSSFPPNSPYLKSLCYNGHLKEALLEMALQGPEMRFEGYDTLLNECINQRAIREGQRVHTHMIKTCYLPPVYLRTRLIVLYCKCECLGDARQMLDEMPERNVVSWTAMISAYSQRGYASEALNLFVQMLRSGTPEISCRIRCFSCCFNFEIIVDFCKKLPSLNLKLAYHINFISAKKKKKKRLAYHIAV